MEGELRLARIERDDAAREARKLNAYARTEIGRITAGRDATIRELRAQLEEAHTTLKFMRARWLVLRSPLRLRQRLMRRQGRADRGGGVVRPLLRPSP